MVLPSSPGWDGDFSGWSSVVYLNPSQKGCYDVVISMWVRASELCNDLDLELYSSVKTWINEVWPFSRPAYPGREITIEDWNKIPDEL